MAKAKRSAYDRLFSKVDKRGPDDCWEFQGSGTEGYGSICIDRKQYRAHRLSWELANGREAGDLLICHTCDNRKCVNPAHLFIGTHLDNNRDCVRKQRNSRGSIHGESKLTEADVIAIRLDPRSSAELEPVYGVHQSVIRLVRRKGKTGAWQHVPFPEGYRGHRGRKGTMGRGSNGQWTRRS